MISSSSGGPWQQPGRWPSLLAGCLLGLLIGFGLLRVIGIRRIENQQTVATSKEYGPVDVGFLQDMAQHHDQAVVMAEIVKDSPVPSVRAAANGILQSQMVEIGEMRGWLLLWHQPVLPAGGPMTWMVPQHGAAGQPEIPMPMPGPDGAMPGMASSAELNRLRAATGAQQGSLFFRLMLRHHLSAVGMARYAARHAQNPLVAQTATMIVREQSQEAAAMQSLLKVNGTAPLPFPATPLTLDE